MRNDHKGEVTHDTSLILMTFYASGKHGPEVRADGHGKQLARGYYVKCLAPVAGDQFRLGPYSCRSKAMHRGYYEHRARVAHHRRRLVASEVAHNTRKIVSGE